MTLIGIDIGGSTTKIIGLNNDKMMKPLKVKAADPVTSVYGAFGRYITVNNFADKNNWCRRNAYRQQHLRYRHRACRRIQIDRSGRSSPFGA